MGTGEVWAWDGVVWRRQGRAAGWPWSRSGHPGLWDPLRARSLFLWGWDEVAGWLLDLAEWDGVTWRDVTPRGEAYPMSRRWTGLALDSDRRRLLAFGGDVVGVPAHDTWELSADPDDRPALVLDVDFGFPGASSCDLEGVTVVAVAGGTGHTVDDDPADGDLVGEPVPGVELLGWEAWEGAWTSLGSAQHAADGPAELQELPYKFRVCPT